MFLLSVAVSNSLKSLGVANEIFGKALIVPVVKLHIMVLHGNDTVIMKRGWGNNVTLTTVHQRVTPSFDRIGVQSGM